MENERNLITGATMNRHDDSQQYNPITGDYRKVDDAAAMGDEPVEKSNEAKWPSISKRDNTSEEESDDDDDKQVSKNSCSQIWPSISGQFSSESVEGEFEKHIPIFVKKADERIVCGIVYAPDEVDSQGDQASAEEIEKAANDFMENVQQFKVMHKGKPAKIKVLQSYIAPQDLTINKRKIKKGSWVLVTRVLDNKLWKDIKAGKFTGYSMAGTAKVD